MCIKKSECVYVCLYVFVCVQREPSRHPCIKWDCCKERHYHYCHSTNTDRNFHSQFQQVIIPNRGLRGDSGHCWSVEAKLESNQCTHVQPFPQCHGNQLNNLVTQTLVQTRTSKSTNARPRLWGPKVWIWPVFQPVVYFASTAEFPEASSLFFMSVG